MNLLDRTAISSSCLEHQAVAASGTMGSRPYWASILQWTLWFVLMAGIYHVLNRARMKSAKSGDDTVMKYPPSAVAVAVICLLVAVALMVMVSIAPAANAPWWTK